MDAFRIAVYRWICLVLASGISLVAAQMPALDPKANDQHLGFVLAADRGALRLDKWTLPKMIEVVKASENQVLLVRFGRPFAFHKSMLERGAMTDEEYRKQKPFKPTREQGHRFAHLDHGDVTAREHVRRHQPTYCDDPYWKHMCEGLTSEEARYYDERKHMMRDVFVMLTDRMVNVSNLLLADVWMHHGDDPYAAEHYEDVYDLDSDHLPAYILWSKKFPDGEHYHGKEIYDDLSMWLDIKSEVNVPRESLPSFDKLVHHFFHGESKEDPWNKDRAVKAARKHGDTVSDPKAKHYIRTMEKCIEKGDGYVQKELDRVGEILHAVMPADKRADLTQKMHVLHAFKQIMHLEL